MKIRLRKYFMFFLLCWMMSCPRTLAAGEDAVQPPESGENLSLEGGTVSPGSGEAILGEAWAAGESPPEEGMIVSSGDEECQLLQMTGLVYGQKAFEALQLVNSERAAAGLEPLEMDTELLTAARQRAAECSVFYGHTRPNGLACATVSERCFGENIAASTGMRFSTAEAVVAAWMDSEGHRNNILNESYHSIGIGCFYKDGVWYWAQVFGRTRSEQAPLTGATEGSEQTSSTEQPEESEQTSLMEYQAETFEIQALRQYAVPFLVVEDFRMERGQQQQFLVKLSNRGWSSATAYIDQTSYLWSSSEDKITVDEKGCVSAEAWGSAVILAENRGDSKACLEGRVCVCTDVLIESAGQIYIQQSDRNGFVAGFPVTVSRQTDVEYSWYVAVGEDGWSCISDWTENMEWISWVPERYGEYCIVAKARIAGNPDSTVMQAVTYEYHPEIIGKCQMPYTGEGGGFLIGVESYQNPNSSYQYEMLILDCTLLAEGKDAWIYTTGRCRVEEGKALWTLWQPQYGYYWTLFRVYDETGVLVDEACYGFQNV